VHRRRVIVSFYVVDGATVASVAQVKWHEARAYLRGWRCPAAFFAASEESGDELRSSTALTRYLAAMPPPAPYLCGTVKFHNNG